MKEGMLYDTNRYQLRSFVLQRMQKIIQQQKRAKARQTVFFGDSIVQYFDLAKYLPELGTCYNCGIAGITSDMLLHFVDEAVIKYQPKQVFLMIGTNDLGDTVMASPRQIALQVKELVEIIQNNLPQAQIFILSCLPCLEALHGYSAQGKGMRSNDLLQMIFKEEQTCIHSTQVSFIQLFHDANNQVYLQASDYTDGLHPNETGYQKISQILLAQYRHILKNQ